MSQICFSKSEHAALTVQMKFQMNNLYESVIFSEPESCGANSTVGLSDIDCLFLVNQKQIVYPMWRDPGGKRFMSCFIIVI